MRIMLASQMLRWLRLLDEETNHMKTYPFRTGWALLLLAGNFIVAAFYFGILK
jgi:photosystem I protein